MKIVQDAFRARLWVVNGYADDAVLERAISGWLPIRDLNGIGTLEAFVAQYVTVSEAEAETDMDKAVTAVFSGKTLLVIDGYPGGVLMDAKQFPCGASRSRTPARCCGAATTALWRAS